MTNLTEILNKTKIDGDFKKIAGEIVKTNGINVPKVFNKYYNINSNFNPNQIIVRPSHKREYNGESDIFNSELLSTIIENIEINEEKEKFQFIRNLLGLSKIKKDENIEIKIKKYLLKNSNFKKYNKYFSNKINENEIQISYWEYIPGINGSIIEDDSIKDSYHIILTDKETNKTQYFPRIKTNQTTNQMVNNIIYNYKKIKSEEDCPIVEFQIGKDKKFHFLQYHKVSNHKFGNFKINETKLKYEGYKKAIFVRGKTSINGKIAKLKIDNQKNNKNSNGKINITQGISYQDEIESRNREIQIFNYASFENFKTDLLNKYGHVSKSLLFKPKISLITNLEQILTENEIIDIIENPNKEKTLDFHIISNGEKAYIKKIN